MVTIEQKLTLFSKLLNQDIKEETEKKFYDLEKEYKRIIAESKYRTDCECKEIIELARRKAELKKVELISKGKLASKKENMCTIERVFERFKTSLEAKINEFVTSSAYNTYLEKQISELDDLKEYSNELIVYLTPNDYAHHLDFIKTQLTKIGIPPSKLAFEQTKEPILGGLIIKDPQLNMRIDQSIRAAMDEQKNNIMEKITFAIEEECEQCE